MTTIHILSRRPDRDMACSFTDQAGAAWESSCADCECEMACDVAPDASRPFPAPKPEPVVEVDPVLRERVARVVLVLSLSLLAALVRLVVEVVR